MGNSRKGIRFKTLDYVVMTKRNHGHAFELGETVMISIAERRNNGDCCDVYSPGWQNNPFYSVFNKEGYCMIIGDCEAEISTREDFNKGVKNRSKENKQKLSHFLAKDPSVLLNWEFR